MKTTKEQIKKELESRKDRSAWDKGVTDFAIDLLDNIDFSKDQFDKSDLLNGAKNWNGYSYGGCYLIYDSDIAEALCTPSELKRNKNGENNPNNHETWLDVQARALYQAANRISRIVKSLES